MKNNIFNVDDRDCKDSVANTNDTHISCKLIDYEELKNAVKHLLLYKHVEAPLNSLFSFCQLCNSDSRSQDVR